MLSLRVVFLGFCSGVFRPCPGAYLCGFVSIDAIPFRRYTTSTFVQRLYRLSPSDQQRRNRRTVSRDRYTVNEVEARTDVPAGTLRQWERRYGIPKPERSASGYRLYCENDIRNIEQMKRRIAAGTPASRAAELIQEPEALPGSVSSLQTALLDALLKLDEAKADEIFSQAYSLHGVETVLSELAQHTMAELGSRWHRGETPVTTEHFASAYLQGRLRTLMSATPNLVGGAVIIVACAPLEQHELGALVLAILLRRAGRRVYYLGANTPVKDLRELADTLGPVGVMISASLPKSVALLTEAKTYLVGIAPVLGFGGPAFNHRPELAETLSGTFLAPDAPGAVRRLAQLIQQRGALRA